jgi:hypothetical protein
VETLLRCFAVTQPGIGAIRRPERRFAPVAAAVPYLRLNDLKPRFLPPSGYGFDGIRSFNRFKPVTPQAGHCAIPLLHLKVPSDRNFTMREIQPPDIGDPIVSLPSVPTCAAR